MHNVLKDSSQSVSSICCSYGPNRLAFNLQVFNLQEGSDCLNSLKFCVKWVIAREINLCFSKDKDLVSLTNQRDSGSDSNLNTSICNKHPLTLLVS